MAELMARMRMPEMRRAKMFRYIRNFVIATSVSERCKRRNWRTYTNSRRAFQAVLFGFVDRQLCFVVLERRNSFPPLRQFTSTTMARTANRRCERLHSPTLLDFFVRN